MLSDKQNKKGEITLAFTITGKRNTATCYAREYSDEDFLQVKEICDLPFLGDAHIRMMPDMHKGAGCVIGTTMRIPGAIVPNFIGVDIGCGVVVARIPYKDINYAELDERIRAAVPIGRNIRKVGDDAVQRNFGGNFAALLKNRWGDIDEDYTTRSVGTLGGGNHYIEVGRAKKTGELFLSIHSGSRKFGHSIATGYQELAYKKLSEKNFDSVISALKAEGRHQEIEAALKKLKAETPADINKEHAYLVGKDACNYMNDMQVATSYASMNRMIMLAEIFKAMGWPPDMRFETKHNYIDIAPPDNGDPILRKGAVSARAGERFIVPLNMRDGSLICIGKGNPDWNYSAPHGAGRIMSRREARDKIGLDTYRETMAKAGVFTTSVSKDTLDEAPDAYKNPSVVEDAIVETADVVDWLVPEYNLKGGNE